MRTNKIQTCERSNLHIKFNSFSLFFSCYITSIFIIDLCIYGSRRIDLKYMNFIKLDIWTGIYEILKLCLIKNGPPIFYIVHFTNITFSWQSSQSIQHQSYNKITPVTKKLALKLHFVTNYFLSNKRFCHYVVNKSASPKLKSSKFRHQSLGYSNFCDKF